LISDVDARAGTGGTLADQVLVQSTYESVTKYFIGVISSDFSYSPSVLSPRPQRLRMWGRLPREDRVPNGCVRGEFPFPYTMYKYPYDQ
jgi:hypothetical protein